ncbi:CpaE family protein [Pelagovum sp. HNIBRBA483]|uniref:AAA family ATPase n=1 Tax=Pelagovum sp. HNIBRBA483 TaxID=3233341 RepID=UPI0034A1DCE9
MSSNAAQIEDQAPIIACTVSRDIQIFDLLIEDMETALQTQWGDLNFEDALAFVNHPESDTLQFLAIALDKEDEADLGKATNVIAAAKARGIKVILITEDVSPASLHQLLREGGDEFVPYPLPEGELQSAIDRVQAKAEQMEIAPEMQNTLKATNNFDGVVIPVQGLAGGVGATTFAVNLAWELASIDAENPPRVLLLDLDLQQGSTATYLDLPRREAVLELLTDTENMDSEVFMQALLSFNQRLQVLTAPSEMVPLDIISPDDIDRLLEMARVNFDYVVIDMPTTMVEWSQNVLEAAHIYFALLELDMRSAQNTLRLKRALQSEELPFDKMRFLLNRGPKFTDLSARSRVKRLAESLGISIDVQLPDGGKQVTMNADHGLPLSEGQPKNPLRKEIAKLAQGVHEVNVEETRATGTR